MKIKYSILILSVFLFANICTATERPAAELAADAIADDTSTSAAAINELRGMGPVGLDALFVKYAADIERYLKTGDGGESWGRVANALDTVRIVRKRPFLGRKPT